MLKKTILIVGLIIFANFAIAKPAEINLDNLKENGPILFSFFASWSKPCQEEIIFLNEIAKKHKDIKIVGIAFDRKLDKLNKFVKENKIDLTIIHDKKLKSIKEFKILIIPTMVLIDKNGETVNTYVDFDNNVKEALEKELKNHS